MWQIVLNGPGYLDARYELPIGETRLGRAWDNDIVLTGDLVSRHHARLVVEGGSLRLLDPGSRNGTFLNGRPAGSSSEVRAGDRIEIGAYRIFVEALHLLSGATTVVLRRRLEEMPALARLEEARHLRGSEALLATVEIESLALLSQVSERLANAPTLGVFLADVAQLVLDVAGASTVAILLRQDGSTSDGAVTLSDGRCYKPAAIRHTGDLTAGEVPISRTIVEQCVVERVAMCVADAGMDPRFADRESVLLHEVRQAICAPLVRGDEVVGALYVNRRGEEEELSRLVESLTAIAHLAASGIERQALRERAEQETRARRRLERFLAPEILDQVEALGDEGLRMEERVATVVFADISGFTSLAEQVEARRLVALLDAFYRRMAAIVFEHRGTVDKFIGDAVMAIFGAPCSREDDAELALSAALEMRAAFDELMSAWPREERRALKVGLATGPLLAGTVGGDRLDYTAVGDTVNVASRLVAAAEPGQILASGATIEAGGGAFQTVALGERTLRGRRLQVSIFELAGRVDPAHNTREARAVTVARGGAA
ncbi:adenylate/guanylate cyclase domain-containing protein [Vulgatibacter incomptus]|uniref:Adenylate cyclase n=1 Tax=Vulgatibacter incomptus TaxID=1391653 RepID=A0A0K1PFW0_9BACT|nr:adenylate/guanylate cyclase domain-containing protein [Vulgatibacter incomptus]AKU92301.1 Adenylate cyclase [Vulgatibacter incomptus]